MSLYQTTLPAQFSFLESYTHLNTQVFKTFVHQDFDISIGCILFSNISLHFKPYLHQFLRTFVFFPAIE